MWTGSKMNTSVRKSLHKICGEHTKPDPPRRRVRSWRSPQHPRHIAKGDALTVKWSSCVVGSLPAVMVATCPRGMLVDRSAD